MDFISKFQQAFFFFFLAEIDKQILKVIETCKGPRVAKATPKKNKVRRHSYLI